MNVLVTGAAGFLGSHVSRRLVADGHNVRGVDIFPQDDCWRLPNHDSFKYQWMHLEDTPQADIFDAVIHCAASSNVGFVQLSPRFATHQTVLSTLSLLKRLTEWEPYKVKRFINISTHSVYGVPQYTPVDESHPRIPNNVYGALKVAQEALVDSFREYYGLSTITLRMATLFGEQDRRGSTVYEILLKVMKGEAVTITGDGEQTRDFNYVGNAVDGIVAALTTESTENVFNIGSGGALSINDLVSKLQVAVGQGQNPEYIPARPGEEKMKHFSLNIEQARDELAYDPIVDFDEGVRRLYQWVRNRL